MLFLGIDNLSNFTGDMSEAEDGLGSSWTKYVQSSRPQVALANDCKGICKMEGCQFYVHDNVDEVCYLCHTSAFDESSTLSIANPTIGGYNPSELDLSLMVHFRPRTTTKSNLYKYQRYNHVYKVIPDIADNVTCLFHCYFDPDNHCQFFVVMSSIDLDDFRCHLGHFMRMIVRFIIIILQLLGFPEMLTKYFTQDNFYSHNVKEVGEWIYNHAGPGVSSKACALICFHEPECDFALLYNDECFLGDYSYTGYPLNEAPMTEVIENSYAKKMGKFIPTSQICTKPFIMFQSYGLLSMMSRPNISRQHPKRRLQGTFSYLNRGS